MLQPSHEETVEENPTIDLTVHANAIYLLIVRALIDSNPKGRDVGQLKTKGY